MLELNVAATLDNLNEVQEFVRTELERVDCSISAMMQIEIAVEEIYSNIANYAYGADEGTATIKCEVSDSPLQVIIQFHDNGIPFNPLQKEDADITLSAEQRKIGGLGIFMVKKTMDEVDYSYKDNKNILTIRKNIQLQ